MSRIHSSCALVEFRSAAMFGAARNRIVSIKNSRVDGITSTVWPHHGLAPVLAAVAVVSDMAHLLVLRRRYHGCIGPFVLVRVVTGGMLSVEANHRCTTFNRDTSS